MPFHVLPTPNGANVERPGDKFVHYRSIDSLQAYMLIAQDRPLIELFERAQDGRWVLNEAQGLDSRLEIEALGCALELSEVYERVIHESA